VNGISRFSSELYVEYFCNYLGGDIPSVAWSGRWVRLSSTICDVDGFGWTELSSSPGYAPYGGETLYFDQLVSSSIGYYMSVLDNDNGALTDIVFDATGDWEDVVQVGVWGDEFSTDAEYFILGFEIPLTILSAGEDITFKNVGVADDRRGIRSFVRSYLPQYASGVNAFGQSSAFIDSWSKIFNKTFPADPTLPALRISQDPGSIIYCLRFGLRDSDHIGWLETSPATTSLVGSCIGDANLDTLTFEYFNNQAYNNAFMMRSINHIVFSAADANVTAYSVGINAVSVDLQSTGWGGGQLENAPVDIELGDLPVILAGDLVFGLIPDTM